MLGQDQFKNEEDLVEAEPKQDRDYASWQSETFVATFLSPLVEDA